MLRPEYQRLISVSGGHQAAVLNCRSKNRLIVNNVIVNTRIIDETGHFHVAIVIKGAVIRLLSRQHADNGIMYRSINHMRSLRHQVTCACNKIRQGIVIDPVRLPPVRVRRGMFPRAGIGGIVKAMLVVQVRAKGHACRQPTQGLFCSAAPTTGVKSLIPDTLPPVKTRNGRRNFGVIVVAFLDRTLSGIIVTGSGKPALGAEIINIPLALFFYVVASPIVMAGEKPPFHCPVINRLPIGSFHDIQVGIKKINEVLWRQQANIKMQGRNGPPHVVAMLLLEVFGKSLCINIPGRGRMFILENPHETFAHGFRAEYALYLSVKHVNKGIR